MSDYSEDSKSENDDDSLESDDVKNKKKIHRVQKEHPTIHEEDDEGLEDVLPKDDDVSENDKEEEEDDILPLYDPIEKNVKRNNHQTRAQTLYIPKE